METRSGRPRWISRFESDKDTFTVACLRNREEHPPIVNSASVHRRLPSGKHAQITFERRAKPHCSTGEKKPPHHLPAVPILKSVHLLSI